MRPRPCPRTTRRSCPPPLPLRPGHASAALPRLALPCSARQSSRRRRPPRSPRQSCARSSPRCLVGPMSELTRWRPTRHRLPPMPPRLRWLPLWPRRLGLAHPSPPLLPGHPRLRALPPLALLLPSGPELLRPVRLPRRLLPPPLAHRPPRPPHRVPAWPGRRGLWRSPRRRRSFLVLPRTRASPFLHPLPLAVPPRAAMMAAEARLLPAATSLRRRSRLGPVRVLSPAPMRTPRRMMPCEGRPRRALLPLRGPPWWPALLPLARLRLIFLGLAGLATPVAASSTLSPWPCA